MNFAGDMQPYRIGYGIRTRRQARLNYPPNGGGLGRKTPDWLHRRWQCEAPDLCRFARRAFTSRGALRKMERDYWAALEGRTTLHQWRRTRSRSARQVLHEIAVSEGTPNKDAPENG